MSIVKEFHDAYGLPAPKQPPLVPDKDILRLRMRLIAEEYKEVNEELSGLVYAKHPKDIVDRYRRLLKELADLRYVVEGTAVSFGLPIDEAYAEVHASNMSKLGEDGLPIKRDDGKVLKGPNYHEADMAQFIPQIVDMEEE